MTRKDEIDRKIKQLKLKAKGHLSEIDPLCEAAPDETINTTLDHLDDVLSDSKRDSPARP